MKARTAEFDARARQELDDSRARGILEFLGLFAPHSAAEALDSFQDPEAALQLGRAIRAEVVGRLPELLEQFERNATARGAVVLWARDASEANRLVAELARERGVKYVTKGKSMVSEEIGLNDALGEQNIDAFETDLGEFIIQLADRPPFHLVGPAINFTAEEVCDLFLEKKVMERSTAVPAELGAAARLYLRDKFHHLKMGITGVNMAIAETGTILNVENEGNIRFCKSSPETQVSIMTLEKVVPTLNDAMHLVRLLCRFCTRQKITSYLTLDSGPRKSDEIDGPKEFFIIIVDNGRSAFYQDLGDREVLRCIRCGACMCNCPVYLRVGGYPYGFAYPGPLGQALNPLLLGREETSDLFHACTLCGACRVICPGGVDHPSLLLSYRARQAEARSPTAGGKLSRVKSFFMGLLAWAAARAWRWMMGVRAARFLIDRFARDGKLSRLGGLLPGWFEKRDLPALARPTFRERMRGRASSQESAEPEDENGAKR